MTTKTQLKNIEFMHNGNMLSLIIILNQMAAEANLKDC
jgi:hypothetical protein